jgi:HAD superfamily 5'-nucleotidase-like hydrolase
MIPSPLPELPPPGRRIYSNRTLNLRAIRAIGFDMDYTLIHYHPEAWERRAYAELRRRLAEQGFPVADLEFDPQAVCLGLVVDLQLGNLVKANRFGYVHQAVHGSRPLDHEARRRLYGRVLVDLAEPRWAFLNTLFSLSEACMLSQLVDRLDEGRLPGPLGYADLYAVVRRSLDAAHAEGELKAEIMATPERYVVLDEALAPALIDLKAAGKKLLLITNSEWEYTRAMMAHVLDRDLPSGQTWRSLFELVIVQARKPEFFSQRHPMFEVLDDQGRLKPLVGGLRSGGTYLGGHAGLVEEHLGLTGEEILYVGDHVFADVRVSKSLLRWRTALILRQLEDELEALAAFRPRQIQLDAWMAEKTGLETRQARLRLELQRAEGDGGRPRAELQAELASLRAALAALDDKIAPLAREYGQLVHPRWGLLMRAGGDKSHLARQIERHADVYTSRPSNFLWHTPFAFLRAPHGSLPHDPGTSPREKP